MDRRAIAAAVVLAVAVILIAAVPAGTDDADAASTSSSDTVTKSDTFTATGKCGSGTASGIATWSYSHDTSKSELTIGTGSVAAGSTWTVTKVTKGNTDLDASKNTFATISGTFSSLRLVLDGDVTLKTDTALSALKPVSVSVGADCTKIPASAFSGCTSLTSLTTTSATKLTEIGASAFQGTRVSSLSCPSALTTIGSSAFKGDTSLASVALSAKAASIGESAFEGCTGLASVTFATASSLKTIGASAFSGCTKLVLRSVPSSVASIGASAFKGCTSLTELDVAKATVDLTSFSGCTKLATLKATGSTAYVAYGGILYTEDGKTLYLCPQGYSKTVVTLSDLDAAVQDTLTTINLGDGSRWFLIDSYQADRGIAFNPVSGGAAVGLLYSSLGMETCTPSLSGSTVTLAYKLYSGWTCSSEYLYNPGSAQVVFSEGSIAITPGALRSCTVYPMGIGTLTYETLDRVTEQDDWTCSDWTLALQSSTYASQGRTGRVTAVGVQMFTASAYVGSSSSAVLDGIVGYHGITFNIVSVKLPASGYGNLRDLVLGSGIPVVESAFANSPQLRSISADSVASVGKAAFRNCTALESADLPACTAIGDYAFEGCSKLESLALGASSVQFGKDAVSGCSSLGVLAVGAATAVSGLERVSVIHLDPSVTGCTFASTDGCLLVDCTAAVQILVSPSSDRSAAEAYDFYSGTAVVPRSDSMYAWLQAGTQKTTCLVVFDPRMGQEITSTEVAAGGTVAESLPHGVDGYRFVYWALDGARYDFSAPVTSTIVLEAVYQKEAGTDPEVHALTGIIVAALVASVAIPLVLRRRMLRSVLVHLDVQQVVGPGDELLRPADVPEPDAGDERRQRDGIVVEGFHIRRPDLVLAVHLTDHELRVHHELGLALAELYDLGYGCDEAAVLGVVVGADAEELGMLMDYAAVLHEDDGVGGFPRIAPGAAVGVGGDQ